MTEPQFAVGFTAKMVATEACGVGDVLVYDSALGYWRVSTSAHRTSANARSQAVALTAYGGSAIGKVSYQNAGVLAAEISGLGAGAASWVRCSSAGRPERFTPAAAGTSDIIGRCEADGRLFLEFGIWTEDLAVSAGGGFTAGGNVGDVMLKASSTSSTGITGNNGDVVYKTGGVWTSTPAVQTPTGTGVVTVTGGVIDAAATAPGASGNVLTSNGTAWTSAAPASGAPVGASYVVIANDGTLTADRKLTAGTGISLTDGGANGNITIAATGGSFTAPTGTGFVTVTSGALDAASLAFPLAVNKGGTALTAPPGNSTEVLVNSGGTGYGAATNVKAGSSFISIGSGTVHTTAGIRFPYNGAAVNVLIGVKDNTSTDQTVLSHGSGNQFAFGYTGADMNIYGNALLLAGTASTYLNANSQRMIESTGSDLKLNLPVGGCQTFSNPFRWKTASISTFTAGTGTITATAAQYECPYLELSGTGGAGTPELILPNSTGAFFMWRITVSYTGGILLRKASGSGGYAASVNTNNKAGIIIHNGTDYKNITADAASA